MALVEDHYETVLERRVEEKEAKGGKKQFTIM